MARAKKGSERYEIDFKFPHRDRELLFKEDGSRRYTEQEMLTFAAKSTDTYTIDFVNNLSNRLNVDKIPLTPNQIWTLENKAARFCPESDTLNADFFSWYDSREDIREMYQKVASETSWLYNSDGNYVSKEDPGYEGMVKRPETYRMFQSVMNSWHGTQFRELNRDVVYDVGDMVMLRTPFVGNWNYDPAYGESLGDAARIGTVLEHKEKLNRRSRGGRGSRMINVLWLFNGKQVEVPERVIKKHRAPKE